MTIRISEIEEGNGTTLKVDGRLVGEVADALARACATARRPLTLDLSDLLFADARGAEILRAAGERGAVLRNVPTYVALLLEHARIVPEPTRTLSGAAQPAAGKPTD